MDKPNPFYSEYKKIKSLLFGVAVGDALGVPVEFKSRGHLRNNPVTDMTGYGTHHQPPGTFSDDSSLTFCLAEMLTGEFDLNILARNFIRWRDEGYWTAGGNVFDIGHIRSVIACFYYLEFGRQLLEGKDKFEIYHNLREEIPLFLNSLPVDPAEIGHFSRLLSENIYEQPEDKISGNGYVVDTLEAAIWCMLTTNNYREAVLKAVNLGEDTDTTAAVTGGLAGLLYGSDNIPADWINQLARHRDIEKLAERLAEKLIPSPPSFWPD